MALIGSITNWGEIQGQINDANGVLTGVISSAELLGGEIVGLRGLKGDQGDQGDKGDTGDTGADGFSPSASVSKVGDTTTITITDKDGTTTANVYDGKPPVIFDYDLDNPTTPSYTEIGTALRNGKRCYVHLYKSGDLYGENTYLPLVGYSAEYYVFFAVTSTIGSYRALTYNVGTMSPAVYTTGFLQQQLVSGTNIKTINNESLLGSGNIDIQGGGGDVTDVTVDGTSIVDSDGVAELDTATQLRDGLMTALDKQKLDGIASGAEVNVQSDWNEADSTADDYIKNKPTIPSKTSDLNNDVPFATTETARTSANGLMSSSDKSKLDGIESGAEVNYVTNITQHFISDPSDPQYIYPRSATLDYNEVGINDVELLTKDALGEVKGVCDLDATRKVPKSRLPSTSTPTADEVSEFDSDAHMNSTDMSSQEVDDFVDGLNVSGGLLGDYVVEQGTDNGWTYRKWNSGTFDAWQTLTHNSAVQTAWGSLYTSATSGEIELPSFADKAGWAVTGSSNGGEFFRLITKTGTQSPPYFTYSLVGATSRIASARSVSVIVNGTWA